MYPTATRYPGPAKPNNRRNSAALPEPVRAPAADSVPSPGRSGATRPSKTTLFMTKAISSQRDAGGYERHRARDDVRAMIVDGRRRRTDFHQECLPDRASAPFFVFAFAAAAFGSGSTSIPLPSSATPAATPIPNIAPVTGSLL